VGESDAPAPGAAPYRVTHCGALVHLAWAVREAERTSEVREDLRIAREASYIVAVFAASVDGASTAARAEGRFARRAH
jgi:hypothetical protein